MSIQALRDAALRNQIVTVSEVNAALIEIAEMRRRYEAEAGKLREACQNLVDAVARARKSDDAVARNAGLTADWDEHEDAHASLIIRENEARELLADTGVSKQQSPDPIAELQAENARLETYLDDARTALDETNAERVRVRQALEQVEWVLDKAQDWWACPWCDALRRNGHAPTCVRQAALDGKDNAAPRCSR